MIMAALLGNISHCGSEHVYTWRFYDKGRVSESDCGVAESAG